MYLPSRRTFQEWIRRFPSVPVGVSLPLTASPQALFEAMEWTGPCLLLESARLHPETGRYSILVGAPTGSLTAKGNRIQFQESGQVKTQEGQPLELLQQLLERVSAPQIPGFPPFVGGAVGVIGFDAYRYIEPLPLRAFDDLELPDLHFFFFDQTIVVDHLLRKIWVIALASAHGDPDQNYDQAVERIEAMIEKIRNASDESRIFSVGLKSSTIRSTHTQAEFERMVRQAKVHIADGEIYQVNLSQRFQLDLTESPWQLYRRVNEINPSPFSAYADLGSYSVICASPERFLRVTDRVVETRPIAGTRPKGTTPDETRDFREALLLSEKERAEHLMLVDLERNDLGRVCEYGSVEVDTLMTLEEYSHVIHIVSNVRGKLKKEIPMADLIRATFPGGTITGCPKIRSIQIIDELEPVRRQLYTGCLGYVSATGDLDLNLLIRTGFSVGKSLYVQTGAGIVADSDPTKEYEETLHKAQAWLETLGTSRHCEERSDEARQELWRASPLRGSQ